MARAGFGRRVEGIHAVAEAAAVGRVSILYVERARAERADGVSIVSTVRSRGGEVKVVDDVRSLADTTAPQGVVADCRPIPSSTLEEVAAASEPAAVMVLDRLQDPHNVGAIARSAVAAGISALVLSDRRSAPLSGATFKAAAGALEHLRVAVVGSIAESVTRLSRLGLWTVGLEGGADESLFSLEILAQPTALVVGGEGGGLSRLVADRVDLRVSIPIAGPVESLNASVAAALAAFELYRVRHDGGA